MKTVVRSFVIIVVVAAVIPAAIAQLQGQAQYDLLIRHGRIVDGTGAPWYRADVAIRDGRIAAIGRLTDATATRAIDATGLVVAPGFIDMMGQTAATFLQDHNSALNLLTQGITHMRNEGDQLLEAIDEALLETGTGWENWFAHVGLDWERIVIAGSENPAFAAHNGKSLGEIARAVNRDPWDVFFAIARAGAFAMPQSMSEANKIKAMKQDFVSFDTDAGPAPSPGRSSQPRQDGASRSNAVSHPRAFGAFPRVLARYVRELGALTLEEAIQRMTAVAANEIMAYDRGRLAPGLAADIVIFDSNTIRDRATFSQPDAVSEGMKFVIVNGGIVIEDGKFTGATPGRVLRGPGYRAGKSK